MAQNLKKKLKFSIYRLTLNRKKVVVSVLILHFLMLIGCSMIAIGTPYNPVLLLWTNMQYENLVQKSLIFPLKFRPSSFSGLSVSFGHIPCYLRYKNKC